MAQPNRIDTLLNQYSRSSRKSEWNFDENKRFENALAAFNHDSPDLFENIGSIIKQKTIEEIKEHYEVLVRDIAMIESGNYDNTVVPPIPIDQNVSIKQVQVYVPRRKVNKWSHEEHRNFLAGLKKHGKGDWKRISRECVRSRTPSQVASHAQKYFLKQKQQQQRRQHSTSHSQNANVVVPRCNNVSTSSDASTDTMVLPSCLSKPRGIDDQPFSGTTL